MGVFDRGIQMLLTTVGAFAAFSLMTIAVGTDYWLYSRGVCKVKSTNENETSKKNEEVMTHSGLWRTCCLEGMCKQIDHFPEDADYEADAAEYFLRLSNIIGIIVYISANAGDPSKSDSKKNSYSYGWSFYFGALSFIMAEMVGVLAVHMFIDRHRELRAFGGLPSTELSMYTLPKAGQTSVDPGSTYNSNTTTTERDHNFLQVHNCIQKDLKDGANRRTTP
ncbi:hypothetical protein NHX12_018933, partial [Muraenolepis orangiensis]